MNHGLIPYIGGKHRLADRLVDICAASGAEAFIDVFGGSAAVMLAASGRFGKLIYNDIDGDLVNLFRVISDDGNRQKLFRVLRWLPPSRKVFNDDLVKYVAGGFSFAACEDPIERARRTFYRHMFAFGGKTRCGGFAVSLNNADRIKEVARYRNSLRKLVRIGNLFREAVIENLHYQELIRIYGRSASNVLYVDPPYDGTEDCYSRSFSRGDHVFLAHQLAEIPAKVVVSYYDTPLIRSLYPANRWDWQSIQATKNCCLTRGNKVITDEFVIVKK
jgi:DNA adenine methylase